MKIGITGAAGYIGSRVMHDCVEKGHEVVGIDNLSLAKIEKIPDCIKKSDIQNLDEIEPLLKDCEVVFHLAAFPGLDNCKRNPDLAYKTNILGTQNIAYICYKHKIPMVFVASMAVFGDPKKFPIKEGDPKNPQNFYALNKCMGMRIVEDFSKGNFPSYVFILCNVYGTHRFQGQTVNKERTVINKFLKQAKEGKELTVFEPGDQARNFIHVKDVSRAFLSTLKKLPKDKPQTRLFNVSGESHSVIDIASLIKKYSGAKINLVRNPRSSETLVRDFSVDVSKIRKELGYSNSISLNEHVRDCLE